jgi:hypothetical protein
VGGEILVKSSGDRSLKDAAFGIDLGEIGMLRPPELAIHGHGAAVRHGLADLYFCITDAGLYFFSAADACAKQLKATTNPADVSQRPVMPTCLVLVRAPLGLEYSFSTVRSR